jgi:hypothetical protein
MDGAANREWSVLLDRFKRLSTSFLVSGDCVEENRVWSMQPVDDSLVCSAVTLIMHESQFNACACSWKSRIESIADGWHKDVRQDW